MHSKEIIQELFQISKGFFYIRSKCYLFAPCVHEQEVFLFSQEANSLVENKQLNKFYSNYTADVLTFSCRIFFPVEYSKWSESQPQTTWWTRLIFFKYVISSTNIVVIQKIYLIYKIATIHIL